MIKATCLLLLDKYLNVDLNTALETYRISNGAFTTDGIPSESELTEYLKEDAQILACRRRCRWRKCLISAVA
jgi:hypothetical protein